MFKSGKERTLTSRLQQIVWPAMGWRRSSLYWRHRIIRLKESNRNIAAGLATGAAISFTPLPGAHIAGTIALCLLFRVNIIAGIIGTFVGNPWTIPLMWWAAYKAGKFTFLSLGLEVAKMPGHFEWRELVSEVWHHPMQLFAPWVTGGFILMILSWPVFYLIFKWFMGYLRATQHLWKTNKLHREARSITGQPE